LDKRYTVMCGGKVVVLLKLSNHGRREIV